MRSDKKDERKPFLLKPSGKDYLWGGSRLNDDYVKNIDMSPLAETWECSTHPAGPSFVASGEFEGQTLSEVLQAHPDFLGTHPDSNGDLPVLIKFIDADKDLSVQVHPDDEYAFHHENGQLGKTEMWYVLDATEDARLIYGFSRDIDKETVRKSIKEGALTKHLNKVPIKKNEVFFIEPGTVHAIGAGTLVAEIQENSNITYRLYDYDRTDKNGNKRELHVEKALEVANLNSNTTPRQPIRKLQYRPGIATELIASCRYFEVNRVIVNTERKQDVVMKADQLSFRTLLCINGCGTLSFCDDYVNLYKGDCIFIPADSVDIHLHGKMELLDIRG